jgi:ABC-type uncharacterized transport system substrate-binding protein
MMRGLRAALFGLPTAFWAAAPASAHPHILIQAHAIVSFDADGRATGVTNVWRFDDAFSAFAVQGYDSKGDGRPTRADLQPLAQINIQSLARYAYFTRAKLDGAPVSFAAPKSYWDEFVDEALVLHFTLPFATPLAAAGKTLELDVFDPEYFAAIAFAAQEPVTTPGGRDCVVAVHRPEPLDQTVASALAVIPADQRELPADLLAVTSKLVDGANIRCR